MNVTRLFKQGGTSSTKPIITRTIAPYKSINDYITSSKANDPKQMIKAVYTTRRAFLFTSQAIIENNRSSALGRRLLERWQTRTEPLCWSCTTLMLAGGDKRTIRSYVSRLARQAFVGALKRKGFGPDGRRRQDCRLGFDLAGTLQMSAQPAAMSKAKFAEVERQMDVIVERLIQRMWKTRIGKREQPGGSPAKW